VCRVIVRHTQERVILEAKVDPTGLSRWTEFHGYFHTPISVLPGKAGYWNWIVDFPKRADESHYLWIEDAVYQDIPGCFSNGRDGAEFTATVNRQDGTFKAFIPRLCISEQGARVAPAWIRASVNLTPNGGRHDYDLERAYFTDRLYPGDVAVLRR
jgi:hypothetical protein